MRLAFDCGISFVLKMASQETPSRCLKRQRFLFDEIESGILSEEDDNILMDPPRGKVVCFDALMSDCNELGGKRGIKGEEEGDILCLGVEDVHGSTGEEIGCTNEDNQAVSINAAEDTHSGESVSASNTRIDCIDLPSFIQQTDILMSLMQGVVDSFADLNFAMATEDIIIIIIIIIINFTG